MKVAIKFEIDTERLEGYSDVYLAQLWHIAQANPAPHGDNDACRLVQYVGWEIIRRWVKKTGAELHHHQPGNQYRASLINLGARCKDGVWVMEDEQKEGHQ